MFELTVSAGFEPRQLENMGTGEDSIVAAIIREGQALVPRGDDRVLPGDRLVIFCTQEAAERVRAYFTRQTA